MTVEQQELVRKAERSVQAARLLLEHANPDFAVSRAYYAMFYVAQALLEGEGLVFSSHAAVISAFGKHFALPERVPRHLHRWLIDAQDRRTDGDYNAASTVTLEEAQTHIAHAEEFVAVVAGLLGPPPND